MGRHSYVFLLHPYRHIVRRQRIPSAAAIQRWPYSSPFAARSSFPFARSQRSLSFQYQKHSRLTGVEFALLTRVIAARLLSEPRPRSADEPQQCSAVCSAIAYFDLNQLFKLLALAWQSVFRLPAHGPVALQQCDVKVAD